MKLTSTQAKKVEEQLDAKPVPEDHPAVPELKRTFGDHTFYLDADGLLILEPVEQPETERQAANVVKVASWSSEARATLIRHEPRPTSVVVDVEPAGPDPAT